MSFTGQRKGLRNRIQSQILTKTEIALQAIKKQDQPNHIFNPFNPRKMLADLDKDYTRLMSHRRLKIDTVTRLQIYPYCHEYYHLEMMNYIFPLRVLIKDIKNQGILYVGYDKQYPGVQKHDTNIQEGQINQNQCQLNYDYKFVLNKDILITLKNRENKNIQNIYFSFMAKDTFLMLNFKVEFIAMNHQQEYYFPQFGRAKTQTISHKIISEVRKKRLSTQNNFLQPIQKSFSQKKIVGKLLHKQLQKIIHETQSTAVEDHNQTKTVSLTKSTSINFLQKNLSLIHKLKSTEERRKQKIDKSMQKIEQIKSNKEALELYVQKEKLLKQTASKCKRLIEAYDKNYRDQNQKKKKINKFIVPMLYAINFVYNSNILYQKKLRKANMSCKVNYLCRKFIKKLRKKYIEGVLQIPSRSKRNSIGLLLLTSEMTKMLNSQCIVKGTNIIYDTFSALKPALALNHALFSATSFRAKVKLIQRQWISKFRNRMNILLMFVKKHVSQMVKEFPHLKLFILQFQANQINKRIAYEYEKDESLRYRSIYDAYMKKLQQIKEIIAANEQIKKANAKCIQKNKKQFFPVPNQPTRPLHRFFRNLNILKSMVRSWFQLQYKKWLRKNTSGK